MPYVHAKEGPLNKKSGSTLFSYTIKKSGAKEITEVEQKRKAQVDIIPKTAQL